MDPDNGVRILALAHDGGGAGDAALTRLALRLAEAGLGLIGVTQDGPSGAWPSDGRKPAMTVRFLDSGEHSVISEDLGPMAVSCRLNAGALEAVAGILEARLQSRAETLDRRPDLLVVPKFSKREIDGGGFRQVIGRAVAHDIPVLTTVKTDLRADFLAFAGEMGAVVDTEAEALAWALLFGAAHAAA